MSVLRSFVVTAGRVILVAFYVLFPTAVYLFFAMLGAIAILAALFFIDPDPCLPFCATAATKGGDVHETGMNVILIGAGVAYLAALYPMIRRWGTGSVFLVPVIAFFLVTSLAVGGLLTVDALTTEPTVVTCSC